MRLLSPFPLESTVAGTSAFSECKACISARHGSASLRFSTERVFTRRQTKRKSHKRAVVCFQDLNFDLGNVSEALQQIGDRVSKNEHIARLGGDVGEIGDRAFKNEPIAWLGEFLKRDSRSREHSERASGGGKAFWEGSNLPFRKHTSNWGFNEEDGEKHVELDFPFVSDRTFNATTPRGELSAAAISCIEQFSRLNGHTGSQMTQNFYSQCPVSVQNEARYLVEYCCFTYLSGCSTDFHPQLKDTAFRRLIFITMLAWQQPYASAQNYRSEHEKIVGEKAFSRIAPVVPGVADRPTAHHLFKALTNSKEGLSFRIWDTYLSKLLRVHEERSQHMVDEGATLSLEGDETVLCVGANKRQAVQMWNSNNIAWPGRLTLTERALCFEPNGMFQHQKAQRLDLIGSHGSAERKKVGPLRVPVFDTAIAVTDTNAVSLDASLILLDDLGKLCKDGQIHSALSASDIMDERGLYVSIRILSCLLQKCMDTADRTASRKLHYLIIGLGYDTDSDLASRLVHMYLLCGSLSEAMQAFSKLSTADVFLWTAVILSHARLGSNHEALKLYHQMQEFGVTPDGHTLVIALKACSGLASLDQGRLIHYYIIQRGLGFDVFVVSTLIDMYSSSGSIEDAQRVFNAAPDRNVVTWNAIIKGHAEHGLGPRAVRFYYQMQQLNVEADRITFVSILKACAGVLSTDQGRSIHHQLVERGFDLDALIITRLIDMYGNSGNLADARMIFDQGPKQNLGIWNAIISTYAQHEDIAEALCLLHGLQQVGLEANVSTFISLLKGIGQVAALDQGKLVHGHILRMGLDKELLVMNTLITMYAKCASLKDACRVFASLPKPDLVTWNAIIGAHVLQDQGLKALQFFHQLQKEGWNPNWSTLCASLKACSTAGVINEGYLIHGTIIEGSLELDIMVMNNLIDMYLKCDRLCDAFKIFDSLPFRDVVTWTTIISGCSQLCHDEKALQLYQEMQQEGVLPNQVTLVSILKACYSVNALDQGKVIHECIIRRGLDSEIMIINTLIDLYAKCGTLEDGRKVFDKSSIRDVVTWTAMIDAYVQHESGPEALLLFTRMQQEGIEPDRAAFLSAFKACSSVAALFQGKLIHDQSTGRGLNLDTAVVNSLIDMYMKCGSLQDAQQVFEESPTRDVVTWTSMIAGCARHNNYHLALQYFQNMQQVGITPNDVTFLSLLSACSHMGLKDEGLFHLTSMMRLGIPPTLEHLTCIAEVLAYTGNFDAAEDVFETSPFRLDMAGWMCLLPHCRRHGNVGMGRRCFNYLVEMNCRNAAGYVLMANMYVAAGLGESAASIEELRQYANAWKRAGKAYIEIDNRVHEFTGGDKLIPEVDVKLGQLTAQMKERGYTPVVDLVLQSTSDEEKESVLCGHCEKQAIVFGLLNTSRGASIRVSKNLRMCVDCHNATAAISHIEMREIIVADEHCIHVFKDGTCSCKSEYG